jgi:hypothetical protein
MPVEGEDDESAVYELDHGFTCHGQKAPQHSIY